METRARPAVSWAPMRLFSDLMRRKSLRDSSGWTWPRSELKEKPRLAPAPAPELPLDLLDRMESARFLEKGFTSIGLSKHSSSWREVEASKLKRDIVF